MHSPTYKHGNYTILMQIKPFIAQKSIEITPKIHQNDYVQKRRQKRIKNLTSE